MNHDDPNSQIPSYIASATPNPVTSRAPWYKNTMPTYAGIFLWFVFWQDVAVSPTLGGTLAHGIGAAVLSLLLSALLCHVFYYLIPALFGMKTGLPLYIVGTSTFGAKGGFFMPGFLMGVLQFGWLAVNTYFSAVLLNEMFGLSSAWPIMVIWGVVAAFLGLKGIQYVAKVATYLPLIPLAILVILFLKTVGGIGSFDPQKLIAAQKAVTPDAAAPMSSFSIVAFLLTYVVGFFATAGAAGADFGSNNRDEHDVHMGGLIGIGLAIAFTGIFSILIVAGAYGSPAITAAAAKLKNPLPLETTQLIPAIVGTKLGEWFLFLLALTAFPAACFSAFIAANSFKTTMPKVNPFISVGIGAAVAIILAVTKAAAEVVSVFVVIGASFGPICGAMAVDYFVSGNKWAGPRAGYNPAGWLAWGLGFIVGIMPNFGIPVPAAPVVAMVVGAIIYYLAAKVGLQTQPLPLPAAQQQKS